MSIEYCREKCQILSLAAAGAAAKLLPAHQHIVQPMISMACMLCMKCCGEEGFYMNCVKPFEDIFTKIKELKVLRQVDDPAFNDPYDGHLNGPNGFWSNYNREQKRYWDNVYNSDKRLDPRYQ